MAGIKEIRNHIKSVEATLKITNAMYLIASSSMRKARKQLSDVMPYFNKLSYTIADILHHSPNIIHPYFDQRLKIPPEDRKIGYIVVSGDKGLAGSFNHNVLKLAEQQSCKTKNHVLFLIGHMGYSWFSNKDANVNQDFFYPAQNPTIAEAREMSETLLSQFREGLLDEVWVVYTNMVNPLHLEPTLQKLLPLDRDILPWQCNTQEHYPRMVSYIPSEELVLDRLVPGYFTGMLFCTLVESFCSEQSARMTAMDSSTKNAKDMLKNLNLTYNRARQTAITQEISEVVGGATAGMD
jgi:F-type H+-transporting ATPase subunit gamma